MCIRPILILILFALLFTHQIGAQNILKGTIIDQETSQPVEFVQIALMHALDSSLITGTIADVNGRFSFHTAVQGAFLLRVSFIGYDVNWKPVDIKQGENRLGLIKLAPGLTQLGEVEITAAASLFRSEADRRVFNVENMTIADGGTAIQLLETLPSVQVNEEG